MINPKQNAEELIDRYLSGNCTLEESNLVERIYEKAAIKRSIDDKSIDFSQIGQESWKHIYGSIHKESSVNHKLWQWLTVAASIIVMFGAGVWFYKSEYSGLNTNNRVIAKNDVPAGKNAAILKLANGKTISLSDAKTGLVIDASKISYNDGSNITSELKGVNAGTISTPKGGQYQVKLPDGTNVWLNSATSLSFSSMSNSSSVRNITLQGEAYFEVAKAYSKDGLGNKQRIPFVVKTAGQEVHVLGTHFNINSYRDKGTTLTTLVEGSIQVNVGPFHNGNVLKPGEQSILMNDNKLKIILANVKEVLAWKNGYFRFNNKRIDQVMTELSRWYNIEVEYEGEISDEKFNGNISKYKNISEVLTMLSYSNAVRFKIEGRRVTVMK
ncbi:MAG: FecR domain-containing protein [Pedobacter sp.]|uniref:FecR family protein n=1 Tax=Pedobacter sp. TaxID=1411316 RepID=UPI003567D46C